MGWIGQLMSMVGKMGGAMGGAEGATKGGGLLSKGGKKGEGNPLSKQEKQDTVGGMMSEFGGNASSKGYRTMGTDQYRDMSTPQQNLLGPYMDQITAGTYQGPGQPRNIQRRQMNDPRLQMLRGLLM